MVVKSTAHLIMYVQKCPNYTKQTPVYPDVM